MAPENKYKFQGQEHQDETGWDSFKWRNHDPALGRFFNIDPLAHDYVYNSPYAFSENHVTVHVELEGLEKVYIFDQADAPQDRSQAGAEYYVQHNNGRVNGPYQGSSYPNSSTRHKTIDEGTHPYNNKNGHSTSSKKGLNIVDGKGKRTNTPATRNGKSDPLLYANIHETDGYDNRGSAGCPTVCPDDFESFAGNFDWSGTITVTTEDGTETYEGTTGNSEGEVTIYRGQSEDSEKTKAILLMWQNVQESLLNPKPVERDNTNVQTNHQNY